MPTLVIECEDGHKILEVADAIERALPMTGASSDKRLDANEFFCALSSGMHALRDFAEERPRRFEDSVLSVAAQLRKAYERGYNDRLRDEIADSQAFAEKQAARPSYVYFIQSAGGEIKIGKAVDVEKRLRGLQTSHPVKLSLLAVRGGGKAQEQAYHKQFAEHRLHGEWFEPHQDILEEIACLSGDHMKGINNG